MQLRILAPTPTLTPTPTLSCEPYMWLDLKSALSYTCPEASLHPVEDALLAPWLPHPSAVGVFCWRGWGLSRAQGKLEREPSVRSGWGTFQCLGVGQFDADSSLDMYNAHLTSVRGLGTACLSLRPFPRVTGRILKRRGFHEGCAFGAKALESRGS